MSEKEMENREDEKEPKKVWVTERDEAMIEWLTLVKITSMQGVRWMLGALNGSDGPVSLRKAQSWCARMEAVEFVERGRVSSVGGALVWPTHAASGRTAPSLLRQTTRHEVAVSVVSARYLTAGWSWDKDRSVGRTHGMDHSADGVAFRGSDAELVEVELTGKRPLRYREIFGAFNWRLANEPITAIRYFCTEPAARALAGALTAPNLGGYSLRGVLHIHTVFDGRGVWDSDTMPTAIAGTGERVEMPVQGSLETSERWA